VQCLLIFLNEFINLQDLPCQRRLDDVGKAYDFQGAKLFYLSLQSGCYMALQEGRGDYRGVAYHRMMISPRDRNANQLGSEPNYLGRERCLIQFLNLELYLSLFVEPKTA
jgi:hypothetical protein